MFGLYVDGMLIETSPFPFDEQDLFEAHELFDLEWCPDENLWMPVFPEKVECRKVTLREWRRELALKALRLTHNHAIREMRKREEPVELPF